MCSSKLEYGTAVWNPKYAVHSKAVEQIHRRFLKFMTFKVDKTYPPTGFPHDKLLERFNADELVRRWSSFHSTMFLHKLVNNKIKCPELLAKANALVHMPVVQTRLNNLFYLPTPRTNPLKYSPVYDYVS